MKLLILLTLSGFLSAASHGALVVSYAEDSNDFNSKLSNTTVFDFNGLAAGKRSNVAWTSGGNTIGTYDQLWIKGADQYGGAGNPNGSNYSAIGARWVPTTTLTFNEPHAYFGFWWSAGDANNVLSFYNGSTLTAQFTTSTLLNALAGSPEYKGSPVTKYLNQNAAESYAFINFFGAGGTTWNKIVFSNLGTSGFENDNHTDRVLPWGSYPQEVGKPYPGKVIASVNGTNVTMIPEPGAALLSVLGALTCLRRRR
ncbi:hypothetical protein JIN84_09310 [Luteolibacter yonseiensis]|uniref:PEP-CTERM protein-sorting domain-containing protein n=1 Tax=Luteolibacter yonseiensis TaxID=1144680 RepID=A0A934VBU8_9BACT|nr:hypothetical protein [Luteolibacter yonseiensis]MBK1815814.1 hypothetical protein [Luteolibacter yonseiensis]